MIEFGKMHIEGFACIQSMVFDWGGSHGVYIISARNGSGKSRLINALYWVLFGKSMYGTVTTWDHIKPKGYKGTKVTLDLKIGESDYQITRCQDYLGKVDGYSGKNRFIVYKDGKPWEIKDKRDTQAAWLKELGYTHQLFLNSVLFGQKQRRLMDSKSTEKKELFDEAFDILVISKAYDEAMERLKSANIFLKEKVSEWNQTNDTLKDRLEQERLETTREVAFYQDIKDKIKSRKSKIRELKESNKTEEDEEYRKSLESKIKAIVDGISKNKVKEVESAISKCDESINNQIYKQNQVSGNLSAVRYNLRKKKAELKDVQYVCPTCKRAYNAEEVDIVRKAIQDNITKFEKEEKELVDQYEGFNVDLEALRKKRVEQQAKLDKVNLRYDKKKELQHKLEIVNKTIQNKLSAKKFIKMWEAEIRELSAQKYQGRDYQAEIRELRYTLKKKKKEIIKARINVRRLTKAKDLFSNKGIKNWLFSFLLDEVNTKLQQYVGVSGFDINFWVDLESTKGDIYTLIKFYGEEVPYEDLSGGQQQLVNLLAIFAIMDVIQEKRPCPLFIGDELFESLDRDNIQVVGNIIQDKAQEKRMVIVTHLENFILENAKIITLKNDSGHTVLL